MIVMILVVLAVLDAAAAGFRDAAGRNALLRKSGYYRRSVVRGVWCGSGAIVAIFAVTLGLAAASEDGAVLWADFLRAGEVMVWFYGSVATLVLIAIGVFLSSRFEIRALVTVVILGPFTMLRPVVLTAGALIAVATVPRWEVTAACITLIITTVPLGLYIRALGLNRLSFEQMTRLR
jgi:hypothetical protein